MRLKMKEQGGGDSSGEARTGGASPQQTSQFMEPRRHQELGLGSFLTIFSYLETVSLRCSPQPSPTCTAGV